MCQDPFAPLRTQQNFYFVAFVRFMISQEQDSVKQDLRFPLGSKFQKNASAQVFIQWVLPCTDHCQTLRHIAQGNQIKPEQFNHERYSGLSSRRTI